MRLLFFFALIVFVAISLAFDKECNTKYCVEVPDRLSYPQFQLVNRANISISIQELLGCEDIMGTEKERDNCTDHGNLNIFEKFLISQLAISH